MSRRMADKRLSALAAGVWDRASLLAELPTCTRVGNFSLTGVLAGGASSSGGGPMRRRIWASICALACAGLPAVADEQATALEDVSLEAPDAEPGWRVVEFDDGYARWKEEQPGGDRGKGGVQVVPAPKAETESARPGSLEEAASEKAASAASEMGETVCESQKRALAVRLLYLRGIDASPESAPVLLFAAEAPLSAQAWANVQGLGPGSGSSLLTTAYASDLVARALVDGLARCLSEAAR